MFVIQHIAPDKPFVTKVTNDITLQWYNPLFDGIPPLRYRISMRNQTRIFCKWTDILEGNDIKTTTYIVRDLPLGVPVQFRVTAYNRGGWSKPSEPTTMVTPGEMNIMHIPTDTRWRRLLAGGPFSVIDRLKYCSKDRNEQLIGLNKLVAYGNKQNGFLRARVRGGAAMVAIDALENFRRDPQIVSICYDLLGYCLSGKDVDDVKIFLLQQGFNDIVETDLVQFRDDTRVMGSISSIRNKYTNIPDLPAFEIKLIYYDDKGSNEQSEDEED